MLLQSLAEPKLQASVLSPLQLDDILGLFGDLKEQHREVSEQSRSLTGSCEAVVSPAGCSSSVPAA